MNVTLEEADVYFAEHLDSAFWSDLDEGKRRAALTMAERQIAAAAGSAVCKEAIFEQADYLVRTHDMQSGGRVVTSQSLDGVGSQSFQYLAGQSGRYAGICPEAVRLLEAMPVGSLRLSRG